MANFFKNILKGKDVSTDTKDHKLENLDAIDQHKNPENMYNAFKKALI